MREKQKSRPCADVYPPFSRTSKKTIARQPTGEMAHWIMESEDSLTLEAVTADGSSEVLNVRTDSKAFGSNPKA